MTSSYEYNKKYVDKYMQGLDEIKLRVPKGDKEKYKAIADNVGKSLNQFIIDCIEEKIQEG